MIDRLPPAVVPDPNKIERTARLSPDERTWTLCLTSSRKKLDAPTIIGILRDTADAIAQEEGRRLLEGSNAFRPEGQ